MYQSLTGVLPFTSDNTAEIVALLSNRYSIFIHPTVNQSMRHSKNNNFYPCRLFVET